MRRIILAACAVVLTGCQPQAPDGSTAPPPADAPPAAATPGPDFVGDIDATGTEPFWSVQIRSNQINLARPDQSTLMVGNGGVSIEGGKGVWRAKAGPDQLVVTLEARPCSDGMSDRAYPWTATVTLGAAALKGCAAPAG
jgi:uncharacterized membrane protein